MAIRKPEETKVSEEKKMLESLIQNAASGSVVELKAKPTREVVRMAREGRSVDTVVLTMEYSGAVDGNPFSFRKNYSFADDDAQYALDCLLIANNRLQMDYDRLRQGGIHFNEEYFTFHNSFIGLTGDASARTPSLRLQNFIHLARVGMPVSVAVQPKRQPMVVKHEGGERKSMGFVGTFSFTTGKDKTTIEKIYGIANLEDSRKEQEEMKEVANRRLERDCDRLKTAGVKVEKQLF